MNYKIAYDKARNLLKEMDKNEVCRFAGAREEKNHIILNYFTDECRITLPEISFSPDNYSIEEKILILHYLTSKGETHRVPKWVTFKNLPGASFYEPTYRKRGPEIILKGLGSEPERLLSVAVALGGVREEFGDISVRIRVFPKIDSIVVLNRGDEEFPPECNILYPDWIHAFLPLEDIAFLATAIAKRILKSASTSRR
ncbi:MAG: hypothetical protein DRP87_10170 [Spirochaetes bacterium]|nr:MAG: hypothetical protein DRP87_10170 [Spirochaetota bacterium]